MSDSNRTRGFTLLEILVVMSILAVLLGLTAGALQRSGKAGVLDGAARVVRSALDRARMLAMTRSSLSRVLVVPPGRATGAAGEIRLQASRIAGSWHFEEDQPAVGGDGSDVQLIGAGPVPGFVRSGLALTPLSRIQGPPLDRAPTHDPRWGFSLEMRIRPDAPGELARFGGSTGDSPAFVLRLNEDGSLLAEATVRIENKTINASTRPKTIEMGQWARVVVSHDGVDLTIAAHNVVEARTPDLHELVSEPSDQLVLGGGFAGVIDEVIYRTVGEVDPFEIDRQVDVALNYPVSIRFNADGRLNDRFHTEPVSIPLSHEGRTVTVTVDLAGIIR